MATIEQVLKAVSPAASPAFIAASGNAPNIMTEYGITSAAAQAQLIGHMAVECAGFRTFSENLSYSAARLTQVWPSRFPTLAAAEPYAKSPRALANKVYNGRMGNAPGSDDGWNFRGSGALQHTGRTEFERVKRRTGADVVTFPTRLRDGATHADVMWRAACSYFVDRGALAAADRGDTEAVTRKVNGGLNGLADRKIMVQRAAHAFMGGTIVVVEQTTQEQADDAKRKAKVATGTAPIAGAGSGGAADQAQKPSEKTGTSMPADTPPQQPAPAAADHTLAIVIGLAVALVLGLVAAAYWRKHFTKQAELETTQLKTIEDRLAVA